MQDIIKGLKPRDSLNVLLFAGGSAILSPSGSLAATEANKQKALDFINSRSGGGGTNIVPAMQQAWLSPALLGFPYCDRGPMAVDVDPESSN
jgi:Ca-activated chloride channel family protein